MLVCCMQQDAPAIEADVDEKPEARMLSGAAFSCKASLHESVADPEKEKKRRQKKATANLGMHFC